MDDYNQARKNLIVRVEAVLEKISKAENSNYFFEINQMRLILSNLSSSLKNCDSKFLLKPLLDQISTQINSIEININQGRYNTCQNYLYDIIKSIAHLNNANGKQNLQGYQSAVDKNVRLLEEEITISLSKIETLKELIDFESTKFVSLKEDTNQSLSKYQEEYKKEIQNLYEKYNTFLDNYLRKQEETYNAFVSDQQEFKKDYTNQLIELKEDISETKTNFKSDLSNSIIEFDSDKKKKLDELSVEISDFLSETGEKIDALKTLAAEEIGYVASAAHSNTYQKYSDKASKESVVWYVGTVVSMLALVGLSIWWFVFNKYENSEYLALIARVCATVGVAVISRYCAIQASKCKVVETKLRKIQLQMGTFDAFVASLGKEEQDRLKIALTEKLIAQKDWLIHDKEEVDVIKGFDRVIRKLGYSLKIVGKDEESDK